ncbi:MAG: hypothetical protein ACK2U9_24815, partial [Anaerolineae bacterium]
SDPEMGKTWERYHLIRECMRRPGEPLAITAINIDLEMDTGRTPAISSAGLSGWMKPVTGLAVAASVAAAAVFGVLDSAGPTAVPQPQVAKPFNSPNPLGTLPASQPVSFGPQSASQQQLNLYLLRHNQAAGTVGRQGFVSFVPIVSAAPVQQVLDSPAQPDEGDTGTAAPTGGQDTP